MTKTATKFQVPANKLDEVRSWFRDRGGVLRWTNKEIGNNRPDMMTPKTNEKGEPYGAPHWAYQGQGEELTPDDLEVTTITPVEMPLDWFPVCEKCAGSGRRSIASLAEARKDTLENVRAEIVAGKITVYHYRVEEDDFDCTYCQGTGHIDRHINVAIRRKFWGIDISESGKAKAAKLAKKLGDDVKWDWQGEGYGLASLRFYREKLEPFTLE